MELKTEELKIDKRPTFWEKLTQRINAIDYDQYISNVSSIKVFFRNAVRGTLPKRHYILCLAVCILCFTLYIGHQHKRNIIALSVGDQPYNCGCPTTDGETELHQMTRYWSKRTANRGFDISVFELAHLTNNMGVYKEFKDKTADIHYYSYQFSSPRLFVNDAGWTVAKFHIKELFQGDMSEGGSTFKVIVKGSHTRNSCGFRDYFDGTYTICCVLREPENDIEIYLMNVNYLSYDLFHSQHKLLHDVRVRDSVSKAARYNLMDDGTQWCHKEKGYWVNVLDGHNETWRITKNNKLTHFFNKEEIDECFKHKFGSQVIFAGASHLRAVMGYYQMIRQTPLTPPDSHNDGSPDITSGDMQFFISTLSESLITSLRKIYDNAQDKVTLHETRSPKPALLIIDSGFHDLAQNSSATYIANFKKIFDMVETMLDSGLFHIVFQNTPPWSHKLEGLPERHLNSFVNSATTFWVSNKLKQLDIPIVDMFSLVLPFEDMSPCGQTYLCHNFPAVHKGAAGREAAQAVLRIACT